MLFGMLESKAEALDAQFEEHCAADRHTQWGNCGEIQKQLEDWMCDVAREMTQYVAL